MDNNKAIRISDLSLHFRSAKTEDKTVFKNFDLDIQANSFVSIVGASGCGKSSLLRLISGLQAPSAGSINTGNGTERKCAFVFQKPTLLPWLTAIENVLFPLKHKNGKLREHEYEKARELFKLIQLTGYENAYPDILSGGMQQRVSIARALIQQPDILLMDEPFSALDALIREKLGFDLLSLFADRNQTVLFVTHSISEAVLLSDRIIVLGSSPAGLIDDIGVSLPYPRTQKTLMETDYIDLTRRLRAHFYEEADPGSETSMGALG